MNRWRVALTLVVAAALFGASGGVAAAHECFNASKNANKPAAGAQVVFGEDDTILYATNGLMNRISRGLVDEETGEGFHGLIAFDDDGDGIADAHTFIVTPAGEIPTIAQSSGSPDHGIVNICDALVCEP